VGAIPALAWDTIPASADVAKELWDIWDTQIRFFGIGAMVVAGVYSIIKVAGSMGAAARAAVRGIRGLEDAASLPRTERSLTGASLFLVTLGCLALSAVVYYLMTRSGATTLLITGVMFVLAFFFVAVASYIVGLVGSSNSPVSGMTICTVIVTAGLLLILGYSGTAGMLATLGVAGVVCCAACTSGDICQDLKIGHIVGATPRRLQIGELFGTMVPALIIAPTLVLLHEGYGIGTGKEGALPAPQAAMFAKLVSGLFGESAKIPWDLVIYGALVGVLAIVIDRLFLQPRNTKFRLHVMPLAVGMYLPWTVTFPIIFGGLAYFFVERRTRVLGYAAEATQKVIHRGLLFASGLVAGEAILGILIAFPKAADVKLPLLKEYQLPLAGAPWEKFAAGIPADALSLAAFFGIIVLMARKALGKRETTS
jgi:putative OPT family oligopeptide transporter